jgi:hypothetical protein
MPLLDNAQKQNVARMLMEQWSSTWTTVPMTKPEVMSLLNVIDNNLDTAETATIAAVPSAHPAKAWLSTNRNIARRIMELVEAKRREVL